MYSRNTLLLVTFHQAHSWCILKESFTIKLLRICVTINKITVKRMHQRKGYASSQALAAEAALDFLPCASCLFLPLLFHLCALPFSRTRQTQIFLPTFLTRKVLEQNFVEFSLLSPKQFKQFKGNHVITDV